ncbi:aquaporin AQPAe.a isoform X1 [Microplitis demolitor]|uniref:aquaporin AQPAe.a isoform X1 n=2 Tax=Microplitis demolitor TaxID=69319 RepID=UPI0004CDD926|nr:aquaporin AQPAe.a isoform X1 [Microplitis demolitor]
MQELINDDSETCDSIFLKVAPIASEESILNDMEPSNISIVTSNGTADSTIGKSKTTISLPSATKFSNAAKIKAPWLKSLFEDECSAWETTKSGLAELIGTAMLVFLGCMGCVGSLGVQPSLLQISFAFGLVVMLVIQSIGHISGAHINPAITVGAVVMGKMSLTKASVYFVAQCLGAILGFGLLKVVTPSDVLVGSLTSSTETFCITELHNKIPVIQGLLGEIIATAVLMFMTCAIWDNRNEKNTDSTAIKFGLTISALCMVLGPYTGCSLNPARSLGPAIWNNYWNHHWIFWFGPIGGSLLASVLYRSVFSPRQCNLPECASINTSQKAEI